MARRLKTLARLINDELDGYTAEIVEGFYQGSHDIGERYVYKQGKERYGNRLVVRDADRNVVLDHDATRPYRYNWQVEQWFEARLRDQKEVPG